MTDDYSMWHLCPRCGFTGNVDDFDTLGADPGKIFCPDCHLQHEMIPLTQQQARTLSPKDPAK